MTRPEPPGAAAGPDARRPSARTAERLVRAGAVLCLVGAAAVAVTLYPFLTGGDPLPVWAYLASLLAPAGFGLTLLGLLRGVRARRGRR